MFPKRKKTVKDFLKEIEEEYQGRPQCLIAFDALSKVGSKELTSTLSEADEEFLKQLFRNYTNPPIGCPQAICEHVRNMMLGIVITYIRTCVNRLP